MYPAAKMTMNTSPPITQGLAKVSARRPFMYSARESSTEVLATSSLRPSTCPSSVSVSSPSTVPAEMGATSVSPSRSE